MGKGKVGRAGGGEREGTWIGMQNKKEQFQKRMAKPIQRQAHQNNCSVFSLNHKSKKASVFQILKKTINNPDYLIHQANFIDGKEKNFP